MRHLTALAAIGCLLASFATSAAERVYTNRHGAIQGYDPVAYFSDGKPTRGSRDIVHRWQGATWRFASESNRDAFAADPGRYAPQYGGYCAYAVANGYTAKIDPDAWRIVDGKLYLNYSKGIQRRWEEDIPGYIARADANWPGVVE